MCKVKIVLFESLIRLLFFVLFLYLLHWWKCSSMWFTVNANYFLYTIFLNVCIFISDNIQRVLYFFYSFVTDKLSKQRESNSNRYQCNWKLGKSHFRSLHMWPSLLHASLKLVLHISDRTYKNVPIIVVRQYKGQCICKIGWTATMVSPVAKNV